MKRILVYGMTNNKGGIESYIMSIFRAMDKTRLMFDFVTDFPSMVYDEEVLAAGAKIFYIPAKGKHPIKQLLEFNRLLKDHPEYKVIYFNIVSAGSFYNMMPAKWRRRIIVAHSHNGSANNLVLHKAFQHLLNRNTDFKLACSELAARFMFGDKAFQRNQVTVVKNVIDTSRFRFDADIRDIVRGELAINTRFTVCHVGRMDAQKNPMFLLEVFEAILKREPDAVLLYIGTGPLENEIRAYAAQKKITENIMFLGLRGDINRLLQAADVFLLSSLFEGLPIALIEAQAAGLRCFVSAKKVTHEADITGLLDFISLEESASVWAERILQSREYERVDTSERITQSGYDIQNEAKKLEDFLYTLQDS